MRQAPAHLPTDSADARSAAGRSADFNINAAWLSASLIAATLLSWLRLLAMDGQLARAEPKALRYRILHAPAHLTRGGRRRRLQIPANWPWADAIVTA
jgi:Transposase DDE domain group 1